MEKPKLIIGITGKFGSGKSTAAKYFNSHGFTLIILSQFLKEEAEKRKLEATRKTLQDIGNEWREKFGSSILAEKALDEFIKQTHAEKAVIDGIRNIEEVKSLKRFGNFTLVGIVSDKQARFQRLRQVRRPETLTWELFEILDSREADDGKQTGLQVQKCIETADVVIENNGSLEEFEKKLGDFLKKYER